MSGWGVIEHSAIREIRGPLLIVDQVQGAGWDEYVSIRVAGEPERHGMVLDTDRGLAVVQVLEGTGGLDPGSVAVRFSGAPLQVPIGPDWLRASPQGRWRCSSAPVSSAASWVG